MNRFMPLCVVSLITIALASSFVRAQDETKPPQPETREMDRDMPGPEHQQLARLEGQWTFSSKLLMPGQEPQRSEGTARIIMALDGRFLHEENAFQMMGMPAKGARLIGYNNGEKKYEAVWTWTMSTSMLMMSGTSNDGGKTITFDASYADARGPHKMTITMTQKDDDHFTYEMKGDQATMIIEYTRKK